MGIIPLLYFLLVFNKVFAQEDCFAACESKFDNQAKNEGCKEGCRLAVIFAIAYSSEGTDGIREKCENGCAKSYDKLSPTENLKEACQAGCQSQPLPNRSNVHISVAASDPIFEVASDAMRSRFHDTVLGMSPDFGNGFSDIDDVVNQMRTMHEAMLRRFGAVGRMRNTYPEASDNFNDVAVHRPNGHFASAFEGPQVGNKDSNGAGIISSRPVDRPKMQLTIFPAYRESYRVSRYQDSDEMSSFVERVSQRARRMSILSQWLICLALLLCLLSMAGISLAIIRQIKLQRRLRAHHTHMIIPTTIGQPLPAKKVPLESPAAAMDYPLIHDTPPPAYDQLSVHKAKVQQDQQQ